MHVCKHQSVYIAVGIRAIMKYLVLVVSLLIGSIDCDNRHSLAKRQEDVADQPMTCNDTVFCEDRDYGAHSPSIPCTYLPLDFLDCQEMIDHKGNKTLLQMVGVGCLKFGGQHSQGRFRFS